MFTGIVQEKGSVSSIAKGSDRARLDVAVSFGGDLAVGESVSVSGVCLTVVQAGKGSLTADVSGETLRRTTLGSLARGSSVNIERALAVGDRLGGHLVYGHIDGIGRLARSKPEKGSIVMTFEAPRKVMRYVVDKGSIAIEGVSLTAYGIGESSFSVSVIPHTARITTLGELSPGDEVNIETDVLGRYVEKLLARDPGAQGLTLDKLKDYGYL
ncbi:MAG: riboflavin synthase [Candidatus Aquicultorales bacterium]